MTDVLIRVTGQDASASATDKAADGIERIGEEADKAKPKLTDLDVAARGAGRGANQMGDQFDKSKRDAEQLKEKLIELKAATVTLGQSFAASGGKDAAILKEFQKTVTELNKTRRVAKVLDIDDPTLIDSGKKAAGTFASAFQGGVLETFRAMPSEAKLVIGGTAAVIGVTFAAGLITALNSALLAGIGAGGLFAGIKLAAKDPAVAEAFTNLGGTISSRLDRSVEPFKGKLVESAGIFGRSFDAVAPRVDRIFAGLATTIKPLAEGVGKAFENAAPGIEKAFKAAEPFIRDLAAELPRMGQVIGDFFGALADAGPGAEMFFKILLIDIEALIKDLQFVITVAAVIPNLLADAGRALGLWDIGAPKELANVLTDTSHSTENLTAAMYNTADAAKELDDRFRSLFDVMMTQDEANLKVKQGWIDLTKELRDGKRTLDENTQAGIDNVSAIYNQIKALDGKREADIAAGNGTREATEAANKAYAGQIETLRRVLIQMGFNIAEVDRLIEKYYAIPREINTNINTYHNDFYARQGAGGTAFDAGSRLDRRGVGNRIDGGPIGAAQVGGIHSGLTKVGEGGWEYARLPIGTMMYPHANSVQMEQQASQGGAGGVSTIVLAVEGRSDDFMIEILQRWLREGKLRAFAKA